MENLVKKYEDKKSVLDGASLSINEEEFVTICGRSGCGKTTLLNIIGGLDRPTSGDVLVDGQNIVGLTEDQLAHMRLTKLGFVFQEFNLLMDMTARENVALPLRFTGKKDGGIIDELLEKFDIKNIANEKANKISGGEMQRVAIARAMVNRPRIILADEPTGNLDLENTRNVMEAFARVREEFHTTIVLATHDMDLTSYASMMITLVDGKAVSETRGGSSRPLNRAPMDSRESQMEV